MRQGDGMDVGVPTATRPGRAAAAPDPVGAAIARQLEDMAGDLRIAGPGTVQALRRASFRVAAPADGFTVRHPVTGARLVVEPHAEWSVEDADGRSVAHGSVFAADPETMDAVTVDLTLAPQIVPERSNVPDVVRFVVVAEVQLEATHPATGETIRRPDPPKRLLRDVDVPASLAVPTVLALFRHRHFNHKGRRPLPKHGFALVYLPPETPTQLRGEDRLRARLTELAGQVDDLRRRVDRADVPALRTVLRALSGSLAVTGTGLGTLVGALANFRPPPALPPIVVDVEDSVANLNTRTIFSRFLKDAEGENEISSLILLGRRPTRVELFNKRRHDGARGQLNLLTGPEHVIVIPDLHDKRPRSTTGGTVGHHGGRAFGDSISSLRFA